MHKQIGLIALALALLVFAQPVFAQKAGKPHRIGILMNGSPASHKFIVDWFREGLGRLGYVEGRDYSMVARWSMADRKRLPSLAEELIKENVDVLVTNGSPPVRAVLKVTGSVPIVVGSARNLGRFVKSLARPGGNITGSTYQSGTLWTKRLAILKESLPGVKRAAILFTRSDRKTLADFQRLESAAKNLGLQVQRLQARTLEDFENVFASINRSRVSALMITNSGLTFLHRNRLADLAIANKLPTMCEQTVFVRAGCLMSYSRDLKQMMHRAAAFVDKILKGAKPGDLPVEVATKYNFVINRRTAMALGLSIPSSVLLQATEVIE